MPKVTAETNLEILKREQIAMLEGNRDRKILEPSNVALLTKLINNADNEKEVLDIAQMGVCYRKTGLYFDNRLEPAWDNEVRYFTKNDDLSFVTDENSLTHKLIIGDNYDALLNLLITHKGKIDVIYIDPPYGKDSMGAFADTNYDNAITRDNLLSMLYPRLTLAKLLLAPEGVIFVSIDDRNQAYVKGLMDDIFGERNFIASAPRKTGAGDAATRGDNELRKPYDYVLIYSANKEQLKFRKKIVGQREYPLSDEKGKYYLASFQASGSDSTRSARPKLYYPIYIQKDGTLTLEKDKDTQKAIVPCKIHNEDGRWMWSREKFEESANEYLYYDGDKIYRKVYYDAEEDQNEYQVEKAFFEESNFRNADGTKLLKCVLGENAFKNPKPLALIRHLVNLHPNKEAIVLDFFAGSGTTGHAVLELNKDGGKRQFILVTNNEEADGFIAEKVTAKRLKRVMTGECYDGTKDFAWLNDHEPYGDNLEVLNIAKTENTDRSIVDKIDETLYGKDKMEFKDKIDWLCQNFEKTQKCLKEAKK